jgi:hypothetical protein
MCISLDDDVISFVRDWSFNKTFDYSLKGLFMRQDEKSYWGGSLPSYGLSTGFFYHVCKVNQCWTHVSKRQLNHACLAIVLLLLENLNYGLGDRRECTGYSLVTQRSQSVIMQSKQRPLTAYLNIDDCLEALRVFGMGRKRGWVEMFSQPAARNMHTVCSRDMKLLEDSSICCNWSWHPIACWDAP